MSQIIQHIQPYKDNRWKWTRIRCRHWDSPEMKYLCIQQRSPYTYARFAWAVDKSLKLFLCSNHGQLQPERVSWYHRHHSYFSSRRKLSTERCCSSFRNWAVSSTFRSGSHLQFPSSSDQQLRSCSRALSYALHSSCAPLSSQWWSRNHLDSSHGCYRLHTKNILCV